MKQLQQDNKYVTKTDSQSLQGGKVPPNAQELEKAVLGAILLEKDAFDEVSGILSPECFYTDQHQIIYRACQTLVRKNSRIDSLTVMQELISSKELEKVGGPHEITKLTNGIVSSANIIHHAKIVFQKHLNREIIKIAAEIYNRGYTSEDSFELLDFAEKSFSDLGVKNMGSGMIPIDKVVMQAMTQIEEWRHIEGDVTGIPSGFPEMDQITRGWQPGDLIIIGARPSVGKTAFALNIAKNAAQNKTKPVTVAMWSLEMKAMFLVLRMLASESKIFLDRLQTGNISDDEMSTIMKTAANTLSKLGIFFDEKTSVSLNEIIRKCKRLKKTDNLGLVIIDYMQLIKGDNKIIREQQVANVSRELKELALELDITIIALSQLSRESGSKSISWEYGPPLASLRESGAIEQDADLVIMLWGPSDEDVQQDTLLKKRRKARIVKHRNGVLGTIELDFKNEIQLFEAIEDLTGMGSNWKSVNSIDFKNAPPVNNHYDNEKDEDPPF